MGGWPRQGGGTGEVPGTKVNRLCGVGEVPVGEEGWLVDVGRARGSARDGLRIGGRPRQCGWAAEVQVGRTVGLRRSMATTLDWVPI